MADDSVPDETNAHPVDGSHPEASDTSTSPMDVPGVEGRPREVGRRNDTLPVTPQSPTMPLVEPDASPTMKRDGASDATDATDPPTEYNPEDTAQLGRTLTESVRRQVWDELSALAGPANAHHLIGKGPRPDNPVSSGSVDVDMRTPVESDQAPTGFHHADPAIESDEAPTAYRPSPAAPSGFPKLSAPRGSLPTEPAETPVLRNPLMNAPPRDREPPEAEEAAAPDGQRRRALEERVTRLNGDAKVDALCDLGDYLEQKIKNRDAAIATFEDALALKPSHKRTLMSLERNYKAQGDFTKVAHVYELAAESAADVRQRTEAILRAAATLSDKAQRPADAFALLERMRDSVDDPRVVEAFAELAEKLGHEDAYVDAKIALAKGAKAKRKAASHYRDAAVMLMRNHGPGARARIVRAKELLEAAVLEDKSLSSAWVDLAEIVRRGGDPLELLRALEESARYSMSEGRAAAYRELGFAKAAAGDERAAMVALEVSLTADPNQIDVATWVLSAYVNQGRGPDAARLASRADALIATAEDDHAIYEMLVASARALVALGELPRGTESLARAATAIPSRPEAWRELAPLAKAMDPVLLRSRLANALEHARNASASFDVALLIELARFEIALGDPLGATQTLTIALQKDATNRAAMGVLGEACFRRGDWAGAADAEVSLSRGAESMTERFSHLARAGDIWARHGQDLNEAERCYVDALRIQPNDLHVLESLASVYTRLERWPDLSRTLEGIALHATATDHKVAALLALSTMSEEKLGDGLAGITYAESALDLAPRRLDAFERVVRLHTVRKDWAGLAASYREMIRRSDAAGATDGGVLAHALWTQLGLVYRDRLRDSERAFSAFQEALVANPADVSTRQMAVELATLLGRLDDAVEQVSSLVDRNPTEPLALRSLYDVALRKGDFDRAWCAVSVLGELMALEPEQSQFLADYPPLPVAQIPGQITAEAWPTHVLSEDLDPLTTSLLASVAPAYARYKDQRLGNNAPELLERASPDAYHRIAQLLSHAAEILGLEAPPLHVSPFGSRGPAVFASVHFRSLFVDPSAVPHDGAAWTYTLVRKLAELRPELWARTVSADSNELKAMLALAVRVGNRTAGTGNFAQIDAPVLAWMTPDEGAQVEATFREAMSADAKLDLRRWWRAAETSALRAGLLLVGDVRAVKRALLQDALGSSDLSVQERIAELYRIAVSERYLQLRAAIGVSVAAT